MKITHKLTSTYDALCNWKILRENCSSKWDKVNCKNCLKMKKK